VLAELVDSEAVALFGCLVPGEETGVGPVWTISGPEVLALSDASWDSLLCERECVGSERYCAFLPGLTVLAQGSG